MLAAAPKRRRPGPLGKNLLLGEEVRTCVTRSQGREFSPPSLGVDARASDLTARTASASGERFPALPGAAPCRSNYLRVVQSVLHALITAGSNVRRHVYSHHPVTS